jgi:hypothetical protein
MAEKPYLGNFQPIFKMVYRTTMIKNTRSNPDKLILKELSCFILIKLASGQLLTFLPFLKRLKWLTFAPQFFPV